jgi:hypothetical protein
MADRDREFRPFDPEWVGYMLRANLTDRSLGGDFQNLSAWRRLVPIVAREVCDFAGGELVVAQTVLVEQYWTELRTGLAQRGFDVFHVVLDVEPEALRSRIETDLENASTEARTWRLEHVAAFETNRDWMVNAADLVLDTTSLSPVDAAGAVLGAARART